MGSPSNGDSTRSWSRFRLKESRGATSATFGEREGDRYRASLKVYSLPRIRRASAGELHWMVMRSDAAFKKSWKYSSGYELMSLGVGIRIDCQEVHF